jgi:hypothetical protein
MSTPSPTQILTQLAELGVGVRADGKKLVLKPSARIPMDLRALILETKSALLAEVEHRRINPPPESTSNDPNAVSDGPEAFISKHLHHGPQPMDMVVAAGVKAGHSAICVKRAAWGLGLRSKPDQKGRRIWTLPPGGLKEAEREDAEVLKVLSPERMLKKEPQVLPPTKEKVDATNTGGPDPDAVTPASRAFIELLLAPGPMTLDAVAGVGRAAGFSLLCIQKTIAHMHLSTSWDDPDRLRRWVLALPGRGAPASS